MPFEAYWTPVTSDAECVAACADAHSSPLDGAAAVQYDTGVADDSEIQGVEYAQPPDSMLVLLGTAFSPCTSSSLPPAKPVSRVPPRQPRRVGMTGLTTVIGF